MTYLLIDEHAELESVKNVVSCLFQLEKTPVKEASRDLLVRLGANTP